MYTERSVYVSFETPHVTVTEEIKHKVRSQKCKNIFRVAPKSVEIQKSQLSLHIERA